ncbi:MAG: EAL domain-containing protein [Actinobacteria bacterium]|nr:MAG: EAL domain-containing protein [Actinomycetota bacterium]
MRAGGGGARLTRPTSQPTHPPQAAQPSAQPPAHLPAQPSARPPAHLPAWPPAHLPARSFSGLVAEVLASTGLRARQLVLETTESARLDQESAVASLQTLRAMGVRLAIDDFGTGYASLSQLRRIPFDILKIDQSFVADLTAADAAEVSASSDARRERAESLLTGIVDMARRLNVASVAEGIESAEQLTVLRNIGCTFGQGFHFSEPMPAADLRALLDVADGGLRAGHVHTASPRVRQRPRTFARALPEI